MILNLIQEFFMPINLASYTFDLHHIIFGDVVSIAFLAETLFRTIIIYFYTLANVRIFQTRSIAQLTIFDLITIILLGPAVGDTIFYHNIPIISAMITISTIVFLSKIVSMVTERVDFLESILEGEPVLVVKDGKILKENLRNADLSEEELNVRLRIKGIRNLGQIEYAVIEASGQVSVILYDKPIAGSSTLNHFDHNNSAPV